MAETMSAPGSAGASPASPPYALIVGLGAATPLGLTIAQTAANVRAGLSAARETELLDPGYRRIIGCRLPPEHLALRPVAGTTIRELELAGLAAIAVAEARRGIGGALPAFASLPDVDPAKVAARIPGVSVRRSFNGRAGGIQALAAAVAALAEHPLVLVVAADSLLHPLVLGGLLAARRLSTESESDGIVPGQGAVAMLLARPDAAAGLRVWGRIGGCGEAIDPGTPANDEPCAGDGLAAAMRAALGDGPEPARSWWTTMTGERFFAPEFAAASIRCADRLQPDAEIRHPAESLGDTGAASGLLAAVLAAAGSMRPAVVSASSDDGTRAAVLLVRP